MWKNIYQIKNNPQNDEIGVLDYLIGVVNYEVTENEKILKLVKEQMKKPLESYIFSNIDTTESGGETNKLINGKLLPLYEKIKLSF